VGTPLPYTLLWNLGKLLASLVYLFTQMSIHTHTQMSNYTYANTSSSQ